MEYYKTLSKEAFYALLNECKTGSEEDKLKAKEKLYTLLFDDIVSLAKTFQKKYSYIIDDEGAFIFEIFFATEEAIDYFEQDKGDFFHLWRMMVSQAKTKLVVKMYQRARYEVRHDPLEIDGDNEYADRKLLQLSDSDNDLKRSSYIKDFSNQVTKFLKDKFSEFDCQIVRLWMESYSIKEIADITKVGFNKIVSRLYYLFKMIKKEFCTSEFI